jgi:L-alanine-DL-glutamate epimerase-like enolase superfamily enzyme
MLRRDFFKALPALTGLALALPRTAGAAKFKITDIRLQKVRLVRDKGIVPRRVGAGNAGGLPVQIGGFTFTEVLTDQGLVGVGPGIHPGDLRAAKTLLVGRDPWDINELSAALFRRASVGTDNYGFWGAPIEMALWDLLGKIADQPLYKLWGGSRETVFTYAAMWGIGTPEERAAKAAEVKAAGWRAIKLRSGFETFKDDIRVVEEVRKATGDDFRILTDGNKAPGDADAGGMDPTMWTLRRAVETAREYQRLGVYWFEEPLPRYALDLIAELNRLVEVPLVGGEANWGLHEFKNYLDKGCYDILMPELLRIGPMQSRQVAALAAAYNMRVTPHGATYERRFGNICAVHLTASVPNAPIVEFIHEPPMADIFEGWSVFEEAPKLENDGTMRPPQRPGLGVTIRPDLIEKT